MRRSKMKSPFPGKGGCNMRRTTHCLMLIFMIGLLAAPLAEAQLSVEYAVWEKGPEGFLLTKKEK